MEFWANKRVLVTGATGFLGHHLVGQIKKHNPTFLAAVGSKDFDLTKESEAEDMFRETRPDVVFHLAGLVGGIWANKERPADFFYNNLMMGTFVTHFSFKYGIKHFIAAGAGCGYPQFAPMPLKEESLWDGWPQSESAPYSLAKRLLSVQAKGYQKQFGGNATICIPGNVYGEHDNFNLNDAHVIPALIRKFVEAVETKQASVEVWGSGIATRDYVYAGDVAQGMISAAERYQGVEVVNLSSGVETSVREICDLLREITGFSGKISWNTDRPDGQKRRCFDVSKASNDLGFKAETNLKRGLEISTRWYQENKNLSSTRK